MTFKSNYNDLFVRHKPMSVSDELQPTDKRSSRIKTGSTNYFEYKTDEFYITYVKSHSLVSDKDFNEANRLIKAGICKVRTWTQRLSTLVLGLRYSVAN